MKLKGNKSLLLFLFFSPLILNYIYNFFLVDKYHTNIQTEKLVGYFLSFLFSIFLYQTGKKIKEYLNLNFNGTGVVVFLLSFYIFDKLFLILLNNIDSKYSFVFVGVCWITFLIYKNYKDFISLSFFLLITFFSQRLFSNFFTITENEFLTSDEKFFWYPVSKMIYETNLYDALISNPLPSYGLLIAHVHATLNRLISFSENFLYLPAYKNVFYFLTLYFIFELSINQKAKIISSFIFSLIVFTSDWFTYLFFNSLLAESISSYFFGVLFLEISKKIYKINNVALLSLSFLYFSKQFISVFSLAIGFYYLYKTKTKLNKYLFMLFGILIDISNSLFLSTSITWRMYIDSFQSDAMTGEGGINFGNIQNIIFQFLIDRSMTYFIFVIFVLFLYLWNKSGIYEKDAISIIILNTLMVFLLYVFVWTNVEYESSYRYLLNIFHIILIFYASTVNNFLNLRK